MNKITISLATICISLLMFSCGNTETTNLGDLQFKKDSLKSELSLINEQIALLDTLHEEVILNVTSTFVEQKDFQHKIELQGQVETDQNILINAESGGVIRRIHVSEGQNVSKGQTLISIDAEILQRNIDEIRTSLEMAEYMYDKQLALNEQGLGTEIELKQAKNQKQSLESKLKTLQSQKGKSVVTAPFSGVIDEIFAQLGEMASPQAPLIRLVNNKNIKIAASVSESHLGKINIGTAVDVLFPNLNDTIIKTSISYRGNFIDPVNRTFRIHVDLKNNTLFLPNQVAKIKITDLSLDSALVINSEAILQDTDNNDYVYKMIAAEGGKDIFSVQKVFIKIIKSYQGESAIIPIQENSLTKNTRIVLIGGKGVTESDIVKAQ